jgi:hypothetical protein
MKKNKYFVYNDYKIFRSTNSEVHILLRNKITGSGAGG